MAFLNTLDNGQYSPTLCVRAGVYPCQQVLPPYSGLDGILLFPNNSRIRGNYDYASNFECGYFNFENYSPVENVLSPTPTQLNLYSIDGQFSGIQNQYPATNGGNYIYATPNITNVWRSSASTNNINRSATTNLNNFSNCIVASGQNHSPEYAGNVFLNIPSSANLMAGPRAVLPHLSSIASGDITIYGRFKWPKGSLGESPLSRNSFMVAFGGSGIAHSEETTNSISIVSNQLRFNQQKKNTYYNYTAGLQDINESFDFYSFLYSVDVNSTVKLYTALEGYPLTLSNIQYNTSVPIRYDAFFSGVTLYADNPAFIWTDFGISNRAWDFSDIDLLNKKRLHRHYYIRENPYVTLPFPSGTDTDYLQFHFPSNSSGYQSADPSTSDTVFLWLDTSNLSQSIYEFDRSHFNNRAIKMDMWVESRSNNPSGYIIPRVNITDSVTSEFFTWDAFPVLVPQNTISLISPSGELRDYFGNIRDLSELHPDSATSCYMTMDANYQDIGTTYSGDINVYSARVYIDAWCTPPETGAPLTLYVSGQQVTRDGIDLFVQNSFIENSLDLYIQGHSPEASGCDLYITGGFRFDSTTLYIGGMDYANDNTTLFIEGSTVRGSMPMYIYSQPPSEMSGDIPLSIWATEHSGVSKGMSLFIGENAPSGTKTNGMNLYILGPQSERLTASMNMFLRRDAYGENSSVTLYCHNEYTDISGEVTLFMSAPSGTLGAVPVSGQMNLFIARNEGIEGGLDLSISGPLSNENGIPMFIDGSPADYATIPLSVDGIGVNRETLKLYINGF